MTEPTDGKPFYSTQDARFTIESGRGGVVKFEDGARRGKLDWEMLSGGQFDMVIFGDNCRWTDPEARMMTRDEVTGLARQLAIAIRARIDVWFPDGSIDLGG